MMEVEAGAPSRLTPIGNIYRCTYRRASSSNDVSRSDKSKTASSTLSDEIPRSVSLNLSPSRRKSPSRNDDVSCMTIEFLRARLLAERSTAKTAKLRIEELEDKVLQLERSLELEVEKRKNAETALQESLEKMLDSPGVSGRASTDSELEYRIAEHGRDDDSKYSGSFLELEEEVASMPDPCSDAEEDRQSSANHSTTMSGHTAETRGDEKGGGQEEEEEDGEAEGRNEEAVGSLPCADLLEPHNIHSDSDWATDNESDAKRGPSTPAGGGEEFDSDSDGFSISLPSQRHLGQLELPGKIGKCLGSLRQSRSESAWVRHVVDMLEHEDAENVERHEEACNSVGDDVDPCPLQPEKSDAGVPYVSFAKYLGSANLVEAEPDGKTWKLAEDEAAATPEPELVQPIASDKTTDEAAMVSAHQAEVNSGTSSFAECDAPSTSLKNRKFSSEEERVDEIFRALRAAKAQLKNSIQRRQAIEKQLFSRGM